MYDIDKKIWHTCAICQANINDLKKIYGGSGIYLVDVFIAHLKNDHNITHDDYFMKYSQRPKCKCGICQKDSKVSLKKPNFKWREYICGRTPGVLKWSEEAKISRCGSNNPMYNKTPWNKGLDITNEKIKSIADKRRGCKHSPELRLKQSEAAKKRKKHGHSGHKHSEEAKQKMRDATLARIARGDFKHTKTKPHIKICSILQELDIEYVEEYNISYWSFDIYLIKYNILLEVDGDYYHSNPKIYPNGPKTKTQKINFARDMKKNIFVKDNKLKLIRFWESDILNNEEEIKCTLKKLLKLEK